MFEKVTQAVATLSQLFGIAWILRQWYKLHKEAKQAKKKKKKKKSKKK